jgi:3-hydroxybutyryl-CoA dehydrogenase
MLVGVCGAGTMGLGIAQIAPEAKVWDPDAGARERAAAKQLATTDDLGELADCDVVIEAAPEDLALKQDLFAQLEDIVAADAVLATNTSSLLVTAVAAKARHPERIVGMHFFNPPTKMPLVEIVAGDRSGEPALAKTRALGEAMGRTTIDATDGVGFLVNRCNRPFGLEALRCVTEGLATPQQIDRIVRLGGGFRMGPFELMDLVGLDTSFAVQQSFFNQSFGEPRWRPAPLVGKMVAAGKLGRKTDEGFYSYPREKRTEEPPSAEPGGLVVIAGESPLAGELAERAERAGWGVATPADADGNVPELIVDCGATEDDPPLQGAAQVILCDTAPLAGLDPGGTSAGFYALPPLNQLVELTRQPSTSDAAASGAERFFHSLGLHTEWVGDAPGLVLGRMVCQVINEACFALAEGVGTAEDIDLGMRLGVSHPRGPLEWADLMEPIEALAVVRGLFDELGDPRYRPAPALVRAARTGASLASAE